MSELSQRNRLLEVRKAFSLNQSQLAKRIGVTPQLISQIENERIPISFLTAKAIEAELGVNHEWLITGEGDMMAVKRNASKPVEVADELVTILSHYPNIVNAINSLARRLTFSDWEAINDFFSRDTQQQSAESSEDRLPVETGEDGR